MKIWLDTVSGTWGKNPLVIINTDAWTEEDWITFDIHMSDRQRSEYGEMCRFVANPDRPFAWYAETCVE